LSIQNKLFYQRRQIWVRIKTPTTCDLFECKTTAILLIPSAQAMQGFKNLFGRHLNYLSKYQLRYWLLYDHQDRLD